METATADNLLELALLRSVKRPNTIRAYTKAVRSFCDFAGRDPGSWTGYKVVEWRESLLVVPVPRSSGREAPMIVRSVNARLAAVRFACRRAVVLGLIKDDFARAAEFLPSIFEKRRYAVPIETGRRILAACDGGDARSVRDRAAITLGFYHGLRRESLAALCLHDIDHEAMTIDVIIKGGRKHRVPLDPRSFGALDAWTTMLTSRFSVRSGNVFRRINDRVAGQSVGPRGLSGNSIYNIVSSRAKSAGVAGFHPHIMRHCFISWAIANGHTIEQIMLVTGHRSPRSIVEYLSEVRGLGEMPRGLVPDLEDE